jgi:hypothetical protein
VQTKALTYFLDNFDDIYRDYDPQNFSDLAFVPAVLGSKKMLAKPLEVRDLPIAIFFRLNGLWQVCTDPKWAALGFAVADAVLPGGAALKLKLKPRPQDPDLVALLERSPPKDETMARKWFEILSDCVSGRLFYLLGRDLLFSLPRRTLSRLPTEALRDSLRTSRVHRIQG